MEIEESHFVNNKQKYKWVVFLSVAFTYFMIFSQRTAPGVITDQILQEFHLTASMLGLLTGIQYFAYMVLQIPLGIWADRYGPTRFLLIGTLLDGIGTIAYSAAPNAGVLMAARLFVGMGDAMIWINVVLILSEWFRPDEFASLLGWAGMSGSLGALVTTAPLTYWIAAQGWRIPFFSLGTILLGCVVLLYIVLVKKGGAVRNAQPKTRPAASQSESVRSILHRVVRSRQAWATFCCHFGVMGTYLGFVSVWAVPYLMQVYGVSRSTAGGIVSIGLIGSLIGGSLTGFLSDRLGSQKRLYVVIQTVSFLSWCSLIVAGAKPSMVVLMVLFFLNGYGNGGSMLTFAVVRQSFTFSDIGVASGFANTGGFLSAVTLPPIFGWVLDHFAVQGNSGIDAAYGYKFGFIIPVLFSLVGVIGSMIIREPAEQSKKQKVMYPENANISLNH